MPDATRTFKDSADLQGLTGDAIVELMILDLYPVDPTIDSTLRYVRFCNWTLADGQPVYYGADQYVPLPFQSSGWQMKGAGVPPNPSISVGNIGLEWSGLINTWEDLIGAKLTRRRVLARYLSSTAGSARTDHWPDEIWFIQQKESENKLAVTFRLASAFDLDGIQLPRRRTLRYSCMWTYRGPECGYSGPPAADVNDNPWTTSGKTTAEWLTYESALAAYRAAGTVQKSASETLAAKLDILATANITYNVFVDETFSNTTGATRTAFTRDSAGTWIGTYLGEGIYRSKEQPSDNSPYRVGARQSVTTGNLYAVRRYSTDSAAITAATSDVTAARTAYNTAKSTYDASKTALDAAAAAVLAVDPEGVNIDVCGKRLQSCRLRFGNDATLPFGGFPGLYLS
jgi:lambda family phage minor tail protein L